jgi:imidazolonepropionase-like amidohydrolase
LPGDINTEGCEMGRKHRIVPRAIRAKAVIDCEGSEPLEDQVIVLQDGRIVDIKPWGDEDVASPGEEQDVIDVGEVTLLPGLIDMHTHLTLDPEANDITDILSESDECILLRAVGHAQAALAAGVTTVCDCGASNRLIFPLREAIESGVIRGPRLIASGSLITTSGGHGHPIGREVDSAVEVRQAVREQVDAGSDLIKIMATGGGGSPASQYGLVELQAAADEARRLGKQLVAHCHGTEGIAAAVEAGVSRVEHCTFLESGRSTLRPDVAEAIVRQGITVCPTNGVDHRLRRPSGPTEATEEQLTMWSQIIATWRQLLDYGVRFTVGTDAGVPGMYHDDAALVMRLMVEELGMTPLQAILAGTKVAAEALGMDDEIGGLAVGKRADIIAVDGNPLEDIGALGRVCMVMCGGEIVCGSLPAAL